TVKHAIEAEQVGPVVVLAGGTNAGINDAQSVADTIDLLGPDRRIVLVNVYSSSTFIPRTNEVFDQVASQYPNVAVADWYETARTHPEVLQPDKVHPNMDGMHMWAHTVNDALGQIKVEVAHDTD
ncbi:MAG TPA: hypothetical protein VK054_04410, partial [Beutenbergiaceae bacterium]|nr:hypothetical protein [Beutenbergiaceae bacterium]